MVDTLEPRELKNKWQLEVVVDFHGRLGVIPAGCLVCQLSYKAFLIERVHIIGI